MKPKAIFLDIDGTLTEPGTNVPPASALEAIRRAQEAAEEMLDYRGAIMQCCLHF